MTSVGIPFYFNRKGWADGEFCGLHLDFMHRVLHHHDPDAEHLLWLDGLRAQTTAKMLKKGKSYNINISILPPNCTHLLQPIDHKIGAWCKRLIHELYKTEE